MNSYCDERVWWGVPNQKKVPKVTCARLQSAIDLVIFKTIPCRGGCNTVILKQRFSVRIASPRERSKSPVGCARLDIVVKPFKEFRLSRPLEHDRAYMQVIRDSPGRLK